MSAWAPGVHAGSRPPSAGHRSSTTTSSPAARLSHTVSRSSLSPPSCGATTSGAMPPRNRRPSLRAESMSITVMRPFLSVAGWSRWLVSGGAVRSSGVDGDGHGGDAAQDVVHGPGGLIGELEAGDLVRECGEEGGGLQLGQPLADAAVDAGSEAHVPGRVAVDVESVGVVPAPLVPVRGGVAEEDPVARRQGDAVGVEVLAEVAGGATGGPPGGDGFLSPVRA